MNPRVALEGDVMKSYALRLGVAEERIATTGLVLNTRRGGDGGVEAAQRPRVGPGAGAAGDVRLHMQRAQRQFESHNLEVLPFPVDFFGRGSGGIGFLTVMPSPNALRNSQEAVREMYGRAYYRLVNALP